jgi:ABC-2 type transport system ATP-binding protein
MKCELIAALLHNPKVLFLDEPTAGVDVELRKGMWDLVADLKRSGVTIILTTHYLEEAEELCDYIAIIDHGKIVANDEKEELLSRIDQKEIIFRLDKRVDEIPTVLRGYNAEKQGRRSIKCQYSPEGNHVGLMIDALQKAGYGICDISTDESNLEDVFLQLTG